MNWLKLSALACALICGTSQTHSAEYPVRPIKLVVPYAAGGPTDVLGRMVGDYLSRDLKQTVVVENKAGAQGAIGAEVVARAEPDGYTLFFTAASIIVLNPQLYKKLPYDPVKDFRMLAIITDLPVLMEVHPSVPAKTVAEFVAYAKRTRASSISDRPVPAARRIWLARCSGRWPASTWSISPTRGQGRR